MDLLVAEGPIVIDLVVDRANVRHRYRIPARGLVDQRGICLISVLAQVGFVCLWLRFEIRSAYINVYHR